MTRKRRRPVTLYSDCSVYNNGQKGLQEAYYAVVLDDGTVSGKLLMDVFIGDASVNEGEYRGVIAALRWAADNADDPVVVISDSKLVVGHVTQGWQCAESDKNGNPSQLPILRNQVQHLLGLLESRLIWKRRNRNMAGWYFEKKVEARRKEKYRVKKEKRRVKRKTVREWTTEHPELSGYTPSIRLSRHTETA